MWACGRAHLGAWLGGEAEEQGSGLEWGQWVDDSLALAVGLLLCQASGFCFCFED